jgi:calcineurin-like phosphoesterase
MKSPFLNKAFGINRRSEIKRRICNNDNDLQPRQIPVASCGVVLFLSARRFLTIKTERIQLHFRKKKEK